MQILERLVAEAKAHRRRIVLPEGTDERTLKASARVLKDGVADLILIGEVEEIEEKAKKLGVDISGAEIVSPTKNPKKEEYARLLFEIRKHKGMTEELALKTIEEPLYLACVMIVAGDADGEVAGAANTTANVLRPALQIIKTSPGIRVVSGAYIMVTKAEQYGEEGVMIMGDCAVMPQPTSGELAQIAVSSAETAQALVGMEPRVAMLSYSTKGSGGNHEAIVRVVEATKKAKELAPNLLIDGELQLDAALDPDTAKKKAPESSVAGRANVLVFPDLQSGNIGYKLVQRLGGATAIGPILQGMAKPVNDLSRGCSEDDIYYLVAITSNQATALLNK